MTRRIAIGTVVIAVVMLIVGQLRHIRGDPRARERSSLGHSNNSLAASMQTARAKTTFLSTFPNAAALMAEEEMGSVYALD